MANGDMLTGLVIGVAATLAARALLRSGPDASPLARAVGRSATLLGEKIQEAAAELGEVFEDTVAEIQAEQAAQADTRLREAGQPSRKPEDDESGGHKHE